MDIDRTVTSSGRHSTSSMSGCDPSIAGKYAERLMASYRSVDLFDPKTFSAVMTATLAQFPEAIVAKVCDPIHGIPSKLKFLPSIAEVREACDKEMSLISKPEWLIRMDEVRYNTLAGRYADYLGRGLITREVYEEKMEGLRTGKATRPLMLITGPEK